MKEIKMCYGDGEIIFNIPKDNFGGLYEPKKMKQDKDSAQLISEAMNNQLDMNLHECSKDKTICCIIADGTRSEPHDLIVDALAKEMKDARLVKFILSTGTHLADTPQNDKVLSEIKTAAEKYDLNYEMHSHDCRKDSFDNCGLTGFGTEVLVNSYANDCDMFVVGSDVKCHYFSGYSNPIKNFLPGVCAFSSIEKNHSLSLDDKSTFGKHPLHPDKSRHDGPVPNDQYEAMELIACDRPVFTLAIISGGSKVYYARAGEIRSVTSDVIKKADELTAFEVEPSKYVVVSPGNYPDDSSLYVSQRALELTRHAILENGEILFLSECRDGITYDEPTMEKFYMPMKQPIDKMLEAIKEKYVLYSHKSYKFAQLIKHTNAIYVHSALDRKWFEDVHLKTANDPQGIVDGWIRNDPNARILFFNNANKLAIYKK